MSAIIEGPYRYLLERDLGGGVGRVTFVMLNPSTADAEKDDPTIRRCIGFATDWGYGELAVVNLYAWRATDPKELAKADDPIGPDNDTWISDVIAESRLTIAAWGAHPMAKERTDALRWSAHKPQCLAYNKDGSPRHPLYVPKGALPIPYPRPALSETGGEG